MGKHHSNPTFRVQGRNHVLHKGIIPIALWGNPEPEASIRVMLCFLIAPVFKREGWIRNNNIELREFSLFANQFRCPQGISFFQPGTE